MKKAKRYIRDFRKQDNLYNPKNQPVWTSFDEFAVFVGEIYAEDWEVIGDGKKSDILLLKGKKCSMSN